MPKYVLHIKDGKQAEMDIECDNSHVAINEALNALSTFACQHFPPPENVSITVQDAKRTAIATVSVAFKIELAPGTVI
jgi:hypothetical protein